MFFQDGLRLVPLLNTRVHENVRRFYISPAFPLYQKNCSLSISIQSIESVSLIFAYRTTLNVRQCEAANVGKNNTAELCDFDEHLQRVNTNQK